METQEHVRRLQSHFFGQIYAGASLSTVKLNHGHAGLLQSWLKGMRGLLVLAGNPGCGKTYLCSAALAWMHGKVADIYCSKEHTFMSRVKEAFDLKGDSDDQIRYLIDHDFYIYDDLGSTGFGMNRDSTDVTWKQKVWFMIIEERIASGKPTIITTNYSRQKIKENCGERTYSRMYAETNCIIEMFNYPDLRKPMSWREGDAKPGDVGTRESLEPKVQPIKPTSVA